MSTGSVTSGEEKYYCHEIAMCALDQTIILKQTHSFSIVKCVGQYMRGQMVIDWKKLREAPNVSIAQEIGVTPYVLVLRERQLTCRANGPIPFPQELFPFILNFHHRFCFADK